MQHHKVVFSPGGGFEERTDAYDRDLVVCDIAPDGTLSLVEIHSAYSNKVLVFNQETPQLKAVR